MAKRTQRKREPDLRSRREIEAERKQRERVSEGPSLEALAGVLIVAPVGYLAAEGLISGNRHPIHWLVAIVAGVVGYWAGQGVYWWKQRY